MNRTQITPSLHFDLNDFTLAQIKDQIWKAIGDWAENEKGRPLFEPEFEKLKNLDIRIEMQFTEQSFLDGGTNVEAYAVLYRHTGPGYTQAFVALRTITERSGHRDAPILRYNHTSFPVSRIEKIEDMKNGTSYVYVQGESVPIEVDESTQSLTDRINGIQ